MTIEEKGGNSTSVNCIEGTKRGHGKRNQSRGTKTGREETCYRCGRTGHFIRDSNCPARGQFCHINTISATFCVINGEGDLLLGKDTATSVGVLKIGIGIGITAVSADPKTIGGVLQQQYSNVFRGVEKLKDRVAQLHIDPNVNSVAQAMLRTPFSTRSKLEEKIKELIELDIIKSAQGPTPWVNPIVVVPKSGGYICPSIDMRRANEAIQRARRPIPTVDEITLSISGSKVFSKLDVKWGYHHLVLSPESREITTFATHCGLFRYKRLLFGVNSASEQYQ